MAPILTSTHQLHARFSGVSWWLSGAGLGARCAIIVGVIVFLLCIFWISRWHAERRVNKGLKPLWYHRWVAPKPVPPPGAPRAPMYGEPGYASYMSGGAPAVWRRRDEAGMENAGATELGGLPPYSMDVPPVYKPVFKECEGSVARDGVVVRSIGEDAGTENRDRDVEGEGEGAVSNGNANGNADVRADTAEYERNTRS